MIARRSVPPASVVPPSRRPRSLPRVVAEPQALGLEVLRVLRAVVQSAAVGGPLADLMVAVACLGDR
jgi:hypothetical protein